MYVCMLAVWLLLNALTSTETLMEQTEIYCTLTHAKNYTLKMLNDYTLAAALKWSQECSSTKRNLSSFSFIIFDCERKPYFM